LASEALAKELVKVGATGPSEANFNTNFKNDEGPEFIEGEHPD
jgi:hypothetical protein